jgi:hypothetical protein
VSENDQPRPDLDAAIDAVLPSLVAVSDEAHAASLRRTRLALADGRERLRSGWATSPWRWALPAAIAVAVALIALSAWWPKPPAGDGARVVVTAPAPPSRRTSVPLSPAPSPVAPERVASAEPVARRPERRRSVPVQATSAVPTTRESSRPDPLIALVRAVQRIPEDAWQRSTARAAEPAAVLDASLSPIVVAPLEMPPIADLSVDPLAPGEP